MLILAKFYLFPLFFLQFSFLLRTIFFSLQERIQKSKHLKQSNVSKTKAILTNTFYQIQEINKYILLVQKYLLNTNTSSFFMFLI